MKKPSRSWWLVALLVRIGLVLALPRMRVQAGESSPLPLITGSVYDRQGQPVVEAQITLNSTHENSPLAEVTTQPDGRFALSDSSPHLLLHNLGQDYIAFLHKTLAVTLSLGTPSTLRQARVFAIVSGSIPQYHPELEIHRKFVMVKIMLNRLTPGNCTAETLRAQRNFQKTQRSLRLGGEAVSFPMFTILLTTTDP